MINKKKQPFFYVSDKEGTCTWGAAKCNVPIGFSSKTSTVLVFGIFLQLMLFWGFSSYILDFILAIN